MRKLIDADYLVEIIKGEIAAHKGDNSALDLMTKAVLGELIKILNDLPAAEDWDRYSTKLWKEAYERGKRDAQPEPLTDKEQRIFLAAMGREEKVCEEVDRNQVREPYEDSLMSVCREIKRKVKGALWI